MAEISQITLPSGSTYDIKDVTARDMPSAYYGTCRTAAATAAKVVEVANEQGFILKAGALIGVKFTNTNTASNVTLNVNNTGAKSIWYNNAAYTGSANTITGYANRLLFYMYDGTNWCLVNKGWVDDNNTYTAASATPLMDGTAAVGTSAKYAREDHVHPSDTTKVDKVSGKGLSTNDYTTTEKNKLAGIAAGAEANVQSDWNVTDTSSDAFIKNKPTIPSKTSQLTNDSNYVADSSYVHTDNNYTSTEKTKLAGIATGAEANVQSDWSVTDTSSDAFIKNKPTIPTDTWKAFYGTCSTAAATAEKVITVSSDQNFTLRVGAVIGVKFTVSNTASNVKLNVNSTGAKSIWYNTAVYTGASTDVCGYANRVYYYLYDGTYWCWVGFGIQPNSNTIPTAYCITAAGTAAKAATCTNYNLLAKSYTILLISTTNTAASALTLNINGRGAKPIYINGTASSASNHTMPAGSYLVYYDGTNYYIRTDGKITGSITGDAATVNGHNVAVDVPANAKFTDTVVTKTSELTNDSHFAVDANYVHTDNNYTSTEKTKLAGVATGAEVNVQSDWDVTDTASDAFIKNKPTIPTVPGAATATPIMDGTAAVGTSTKYARQDHVHPSDTSRVPTSRTINGKALSSNITLSAADVGALDSSSSLDATKLTGMVPTASLPSYVDDVLEYTNKASFPATGQTGKIYVDKATNLTYRWSGSAYVQISPSLALGTTSSTAYRGDYGNTAYTHATDSSRLTTATSSGLYKVAATAQGHIASLTAVTKADITALGIPGTDTNTDTKVTQTNTTTNADYRVLFSENANDTTQDVGARKNTNFKYNPSTGNVNLPNLIASGKVTVGSHAVLEYNASTASLDFSFI